jgi:heme A synthase
MSAMPDGALQTLHMIHRTFGTIVGIVTIIAAIKVFAAATSWPQLRAFVAIAPVLVIGQITLGIFTVLTMRAVPLAVAHFAGGESLWALWMYAWLMTGRYVPESAGTLPKAISL